jgi:hypothetical protein
VGHTCVGVERCGEVGFGAASRSRAAKLVDESSEERSGGGLGFKAEFGAELVRSGVGEVSGRFTR